MAKKELCISCSSPMKKAIVKYRGEELEALECPKCKRKIFTEDLTLKAISVLESKRLENEYVKKPIKVGHSWGMTFPKEIVEVFDIGNVGVKLKIHPDVMKKVIEISIK